MRSTGVLTRALILFSTSIGMLAFGMLACRSERKQAPPHIVDTTTTAPPPLALHPSHFDIPLAYDFAPIMDIVEHTVPQTFGSLDSVHVVGDDSSKHYAYTATRGPFTAVAGHGVVRLRARVSYAARGYYKPRIGPTLSAGCGGDDPAERPRIVVEIAAPITLTPDWHLSTRSSLTRLAPVSDSARDRCTVSLIKYDVTDHVIDAARNALTQQLPSIDRKVSHVDLTHLAQGWWDMLNRPIHLTDSVWLVLHPQQIRLGKVSGFEHTLLVRAGLDATPQIVTGAQPTVTPTSVPPLARDTVSNGYHITLDGIIDYATAARAITAAVGGKVFIKGGQTVRIRSVDVTPTTRDRLALTVHFAGNTDGWLRFVGLPKYDARHMTITVPDLDYDIETNNGLVNAYTWLRSDRLREQFRKQATISVKPALDRGKLLLSKGLNRKLGDVATLSASVDSVAVRGLYVTKGGVLVRAEASGNASMSVKQRRHEN